MAELSRQCTGTRGLMLEELEKLQAPLRVLKALSQCLEDAEEDVEIRRSLAVIVCRALVLEEQIGNPRLERMLMTRPSGLEAEDPVRGTT